MRQLLARVVSALFGLFFIMALQNLGVELLPLIAGLGGAGAGVVLATKGVLSNVVAGLSIIFSKPFRVGEYIAIAGVEGTVETIALFKPRSPTSTDRGSSYPTARLDPLPVIQAISWRSPRSISQ